MEKNTNLGRDYKDKKKEKGSDPGSKNKFQNRKFIKGKTHRKMRPIKNKEDFFLLDAYRLSPRFLEAELERDKERYINWLFDEFDMLFFNETLLPEQAEEIAMDLAEYYTKLILENADNHQFEEANFILNLISLHFPKVRSEIEKKF